ncbi:hypothetical protein [uncultured Bradyrhizobium sp.]|jgi:hypothetical protein|uniref:hypothetical protein n=1 Tax=uncultured Bradyrhizobium sp. TaxID=199684 RepID=UPI0026256C1D|nr:hypothetical protein [uncultured Bradyrhizobium sp.]
MSKRSRSGQATRGQNGNVIYGITLLTACVVVDAIAMLGVRFYAHHIGFVGGLLTIAVMLIAAHWYDHHQRRKQVEILPPDRRDGPMC